MSKLLLLVSVITFARGLELTAEDWDAKTSGKTVLIKFFAPWCGHCKAMKPDWDKLMSKFAGHATALVADVDCIGAGKTLCESNGVDSYPTLKWGDPMAIDDYQGGRSYEELESFATENLKPVCGPNHLDLCDAEKKAVLEGYLAMAEADLEAELEKKNAEYTEAETVFDAAVMKLQEDYERLEKEKADAQAAVKSGGLHMLKAVRAARGIKKDPPEAEL